MKVQRALISVFNKSGLESFAQGLSDMGVQLISTGGTARLLKDSGIPVTLVEEVTGFPEMLDGRVKTMHPKLMAGILARRDVPEHMETIKAHGIEPIDMVVCSLYPFEEVANRRGVEDEVVIENIDIGGPSMIRAAAKNHAGVAVVTSHQDYDGVLDELAESGGELSYDTLRDLATKAFHRTAHYDFVIANWFSEAGGDFPEYVMRDYEKVLELKYGENPHQRAAYYAEVGMRQHLLSQVEQLHGKQLGFNNLYDLNAARNICDEFTLPCVTIIKHNNPCGCALAENLAAAYDKAFACDPVSAFGSRHRRQPHRGRAARRAPRRPLRRGPLRARLRGGGAGDPQAQGRHPPAAQRGAPPGQPRRARLQARPRRHPGAGQGQRPGGARRDGGRDQSVTPTSRSGATSSSPSASPSTSRATPS